jgi:hypothetical protein
VRFGRVIGGVEGFRKRSMDARHCTADQREHKTAGDLKCTCSDGQNGRE